MHSFSRGEKDPDSQVQILSHISNIFLDERMLNAAMNVATFNEFFAIIKNIHEKSS